MKTRPQKLIYFVAVDWFFYSHFFARAKAAEESGYEIVVITKVSSPSTQMSRTKFRFIDLEFDRASINPVFVLITIVKLLLIFRREKPCIVHQVAIKPILLGGFAARIVGVKCVVNAFVGGGYAFTSSTMLMRILRPILSLCLRFVLCSPGSKAVFENSDDLRLFLDNRYVVPTSAVLIRGAGVDPAAYIRRRSLNSPLLVVLPARLLWEKGLAEFVSAARLLRGKGLKARFAVVGGADPSNWGAIPPAVVEEWRVEGSVEIWGFQTDMPRVLAQADIVCLPSYREGLPKALLEGMAASLPCVTTDVPGCREVVSDGFNGLLVPARDVSSLAAALETLLNNPGLRRRMGERGRQRVELEFAERHINEKTLELYREMLN